MDLINTLLLAGFSASQASSTASAVSAGGAELWVVPQSFAGDEHAAGQDFEHQRAGDDAELF